MRKQRFAHRFLLKKLRFLRHDRDTQAVLSLEIAVVELDRCADSGEVARVITDSRFDVPTTLDSFGGSLYAVNARFGTTPTPDTTYTLERVSLRGGHGDR